MKRIIIVALLGLLAFTADAHRGWHGRAYGHYGRAQMWQGHRHMAYGWEQGYNGRHFGGGYSQSSRGGWNGNRGNRQYGQSNGNRFNNGNNSGNGQGNYNQNNGAGSGYNNQSNGQWNGGGRIGNRRQ